MSLSLLRKVEQGSVPASPAFVSAVARVLGVGVAELLGQPYLRETAADHRCSPRSLRCVASLTAYLLEPGDGVWPRPVSEPHRPTVAGHLQITAPTSTHA